MPRTADTSPPTSPADARRGSERDVVVILRPRRADRLAGAGALRPAAASRAAALAAWHEDHLAGVYVDRLALRAVLRLPLAPAKLALHDHARAPLEVLRSVLALP